MKVEELDTLIYVLRRKKRFNLLVYVVVFNLTLVGVFLSLQYDGFLAGLFLGISSAVSVASLVLIVKWFLEDKIMQHPVTEVVRNHADKVVWVYWHRTENMPFGVKVVTFHRIYIHLNNSNFVYLSVHKGEVDRLMKFFKLHFKHAAFGYSKEREQMFNIHPELLSRD